MGGTFDGWPKCTAELKVLDPCCGSGHFLVAVFELLVRLRMLAEGLSVETAVDAVIQDNLFGLELDPRCTQIAAFNVAVAAWKLTGPRPLPAMKNIACTGLSVGVPREQWMKALEADGTTNLRFYFGQLYDMFSNASTLGSLINPNRFLGSQMLKKEEMDRLFRVLESVIASDPKGAPEEHELGVAAQGLARAAELLASQYNVVLTNVPYLGRGKQNDTLKEHIDTYYELGKADLATAFVLRCVEFCNDGGASGLVTPQNWLFLSTYKHLRRMLLEQRRWNCVTRLGSNAFRDMNWWAATTALLIVSCEIPSAVTTFGGLDVSSDKSQDAKAAMLCGKQAVQIAILKQEQQLQNPDARIVLNPSSTETLLGEFAQSLQGIATADYPMFGRYFWEFPEVIDPWSFQQSSVSEIAPYGGRQWVLNWSNGEGILAKREQARIQGLEALGRNGVAVSQMRNLPSCLYTGELFDNNVAAVVPLPSEMIKHPRLLDAIWAFCSSEEFCAAIREIDQKSSVTNATISKVPFDLPLWSSVAEQRLPNGVPAPESDDPTQWLFHGRPDSSSSPAQVAIARLLGYRWPAELDPEMRLSDRARQLVQSCEALLPLADEDGIVCIPSVRGEDTAAARLTRLLEACNLKPPHKLDDWLRNEFFKEHCELFQQRPFIWHIWDGRKADGFHALINYHKLCQVDETSSLVHPSGSGGQSKSLEGSSTLSHSGRKLLENLTYSYLGDWINRQESDVKRGESGADGRLAAAKTLQQQLVAILKGEPPYDIFVRWKPLHEQPIGWHPDINDGVRMNIRPFMAVDIPGGRTGAGILRWGPKIKWTKDRGKEPKRPRDEYPWFWGWDEQTTDFPGTDTPTGDRWNDCHYTNAFKQAARKAHG